MKRLLKLVLVVVAVLAAVGQAAVAASPTWTVAATLSLGTEGVAVDCGGVSVCWSLESGRLLSSADGGQSWTDRTDLVPAGIASLDDLDCVSTQHCYVAATDTSGAAQLLFVDHGALTQHAIPGAPTLSSISCITPDILRRRDRHDLLRLRRRRRDLGPGQPGPHPARQAGRRLHRAHRGLLPRRQLRARPHGPAIGQPRPVVDVADRAVQRRRDLRHRLRVHDRVLRHRRGLFRRRHRDPDGRRRRALELRERPVPRLRAAFGVVPCDVALHRVRSVSRRHSVRVRDDGRPTLERPDRGPGRHRPAGAGLCPTTTSCTAVASAAAFVTTDSGATWPTVDVPAGLEAPGALTCANDLDVCRVRQRRRRQAVRDHHRRDSAPRGRSAALPDGTGRPAGIDCPTRLVCYGQATVPITGTPRSQTQFLKSVDGGASWSITSTRLGGLRCDRLPHVRRPASPPATTPRGHSKILVTTDSGGPGTRSSPPDTTTLAGFACGDRHVLRVRHGYVRRLLDGVHDRRPGRDLRAACDARGGLVRHGLRGHLLHGGRRGRRRRRDRHVPGRRCDLGHRDRAAAGPADQQRLVRQPDVCAASTYDFTFETGGPRIVGTIDAGATWRHPRRAGSQRGPDRRGVLQHARCIASDYSTAANPIIVCAAARDQGAIASMARKMRCSLTGPRRAELLRPQADPQLLELPADRADVLGLGADGGQRAHQFVVGIAGPRARAPCARGRCRRRAAAARAGARWRIR